MRVIAMVVGVVKHVHEHAYENTFCTNNRPGMTAGDHALALERLRW